MRYDDQFNVLLAEALADLLIDSQAQANTKLSDSLNSDKASHGKLPSVHKMLQPLDPPRGSQSKREH